MKKLPFNKGLHIWRVHKCADGTVLGIVDAVRGLGLSTVFIKVADGIAKYNGDLIPLVNALKANGILVFGWHYVYAANNPDWEINVAIDQINTLSLDGYSVDAEKHYKPAYGGNSGKASNLMSGIKEHCNRKNIPLGLTTYRFPSYHRDLPWSGFLPYADFWEPQVYWNPRPNAARTELLQSMAEWEQLAADLNLPWKPFYPIMRIYWGDGYPEPGPEAIELLQFMDTCKLHDAPLGNSGWSMDAIYGQSRGTEWFNVIANFSYDNDTPPPPVLDLEERVSALESKVADLEHRVDELENSPL